MSLKFITDESERNATFIRKRNQLVKELAELAVLHGAETCMIIYNPCKGEYEAWPNPREVHRLTMRFEALIEAQKNKAKEKEEEDKLMVKFPSPMVDPNEKKGKEGSSPSSLP